MGKASLDSRGRLTLPKEIRERYGSQYRIVELHDGIKLIPVDENPLEALRAEFEEVEKSASELRETGRNTFLEGAGR